MITKKIKVAILFGGMSGEHEVSIMSAVSVAQALDRSKYDVTMLGIDKTGRWLLPNQTELLAQTSNPRLVHLNQQKNSISFVPYANAQQIVPLNGIFSNKEPTHFDVVIPILHGTYGEDGTIQGLLELAHIPYVGSGVLGSALGMDKDVSRRLLASVGIPVVPTAVIKKSHFQKNPQAIIQKMSEDFAYPHFIKPANMGSSVGVHKVKSKEKALAYYQDAFKYDVKILVEKAIKARELEVSILGNEEPKASVIGEIIPTHEFYSYEAKYMDENGATLKIPAENLSDQQKKQIQEMAILAFKTLECSGLARVDFFMDRETQALYLNEINTIPGFTSISMYPKLWDASGLAYPQLLDELIRLAIERHTEKSALKTSFDVEDKE